MLRVFYPRMFFRTSRAASGWLLLAFTMSLTMVAVMAGHVPRPGDLALLTTCVSLPSLLTFRVLKTLGQLERQQSEPDATMLLLFDLSLMLPVFSLLFASYAMAAAR